MTYQSYSDQHRQTFSDIRIDFCGQNVTQYVVFAETSFESVGAAQPGTCNIVLRGEPAVLALLDAGTSLKLTIDGEIRWQGFASIITRGYFFADKATPKVTIQGVDLNILYDRLIVYNHDEMTKWPTGGGAYPKGVVPTGTSDRDYIINMLKDTDLSLIVPKLKTNLIAEIGTVAPDDPDGDTASTVSSGSTLRALFEDVSASITANINQAGSIIWYIDPKAQIIYNDIDTLGAPFSVSDDGSTDVACRELEIVRDASHLKNDVFMFASELNPSPTSKQSLFRYKHSVYNSSIEKYGRFQYAEVAPSTWSKALLYARAAKIITQENMPGLRASFSIYKPGLFPGQVLSVSAAQFGLLENIPIRSVSMRFETPNLAKFSVMCSYDTNDPWGVLLAMKRPASRGLVQPRLQTVRRRTGDDVRPLDYYTHVEETPHGLGGGVYQCSYKYIRSSLVVYINRAHAERSMDAGSADATEFYESDPMAGKFTTEGTGRIWVAYHTAGNL
jgi:hypothetical protein